MNVWEQAATNDPETSHLAAEEAVKSGLIARQRDVILALVRKHPGRTSGELGHLSDSPLDRYQIARQLRGMTRDGLIYEGKARRCEVTGRECLTWWVRAQQLDLPVYRAESYTQGDF